MKRLWTLIFSSIGLLMLILDSKTGLQGAVYGIRLCLGTVIPSLFPFFVVSILLSSAVTGTQSKLLSPLGRLCRMPKGSESLLIIGLLGGYPVGAQAVAQAYENGQLKKHDAQRLLGFCSNAGPSFLFGMVALQFESPGIIWMLWLIHMISAITVGVLLPGDPAGKASLSSGPAITLPQAVHNALKAMANVCGWIVLMRVIIHFLSRWVLWLLPADMGIMITGILELANGCCSLHLIENEGLRFICCAAFLGLGGICVWLQTVSVTGSLGTGMYVPGKLLQGAISVLLASIIQYFLFPAADTVTLSWLIWAFVAGIFVVFMMFLRKKSRNSRLVRV